MINNYLKNVARYLTKNLPFVSINLFGLTAGMTTFIIVLLYLQYELSYDRWHPALDQVFRLSLKTKDNVPGPTPAPLARFLTEKLPIIEQASRVQSAGSFKYLLITDDQKIYQHGGIEADSLFFSVFPFKIIKGLKSNTLGKPNAIALSSDLAKKLFGEDEAIGKTIKIHNAFDCEVTAIFESQNKPSHLEAEFVFRPSYESSNNSWYNFSYDTYVKTLPGINKEILIDQIDPVYYDERIKKKNVSFAEYRKSGNIDGIFADKVSDIHNRPTYGSSNFKTILFVFLFSLFILIICSINFSNFSIVSNINRAKEISVRRILGSDKRKLIVQSFLEIFVQCIIALTFSILTVLILLPYFNTLFHLDLKLFQIESLGFISIGIIICILLIVFLSGLYPAFFIPGINLMKAIKGNYSEGSGSNLFRNVMITIQFSLSALFITCALIIGNQIKFIQKSDKGFSGTQVMRLQTNQKTREANFDKVKQYLLTIPGVEFVSKSTAVPGDEHIDSNKVAFKMNANEYNMVSVKISTDYFETMGMKLKDGRFFNDKLFSDQKTRSAILNESAARLMGISQIGNEQVSYPGCDTLQMDIVGIVKDFHTAGFENVVQPTVFTIGNTGCFFQSGGGLLLKLSGSDLSGILASIENAWKKIDPVFPIQYSFIDENFNNLIREYSQLQGVIRFFTIIAILISTMGLFVIAAYLLNGRYKEISIRKLLGATGTSLFFLLIRNFIFLILISVLISVPLGLWLNTEWLETFSYRVEIGPMPFIWACLILLSLALVTILYHVIKAIWINPLQLLKHNN